MKHIYIISDPDTARSLTEMLQVNKSLTHLDLSENYAFSQRGACCIFNGIQHNTTLTHFFKVMVIYFKRNHDKDPDTVRSLNLMLQLNKSLTHLDLSKCTYFTELEASFIFVGLQHNTCFIESQLYRYNSY